MAIELTLPNMLELIAILSPILLGFFLIMVSLFNQDVKGLVYLSGVLIASVINIFLMNIIKNNKEPAQSSVCDIIALPFIGAYNSPCTSSMFIAFTIAYLVLPMQYNNQMNYAVLITLLLMLAVSSVTKVLKKCTTYGGTVLGTLVGLVMGTVWYSIFHMSGYDSLLYFDELKSNNVQCSRPSKQSFKCSVYKNGQLISSNVV